MKRLSAAMLGLAFVMSGCATAPGSVQREWSANMRELGIVPIFPPREDVFVGDVLITPSYTAEAVRTFAARQGYANIGTLYKRLPDFDAVKATYQERPSYPSSSAGLAKALQSARGSNGVLDEGIPVPQGDDGVIAKPAPTTRLRQVAFPGFLLASVSGAQAEMLVPSEAIGFGVSARSAKSASLSIPVAESVSVAADDMMQVAMTEHFLPPSGEPCNQLAVFANREGDDESLIEQGYVRVIVINEVFYARAIDVSFHRAEGAAISAKYAYPKPTPTPSTTFASNKQPQGEAQSNKEGKDSSGAGGGTGNSTAAGTTDTTQKPAAPPQNDEATARLDEAQASLSGITSPGVGVKAFFGDSGDVSLRRTYEHPIAIGFRGVHLRVRLSDCSTGVALTSTSAPTAAYESADELHIESAPPKKPD